MWTDTWTVAVLLPLLLAFLVALPLRLDQLSSDGGEILLGRRCLVASNCGRHMSYPFWLLCLTVYTQKEISLSSLTAQCPEPCDVVSPDFIQSSWRWDLAFCKVPVLHKLPAHLALDGRFCHQIS